MKIIDFIKGERFRVYFLSITITLLVGTIAGIITSDSGDIYATLNKPPLAPPAWVFPVVWTILYILMGISLGKVLIKGKDDLKQRDKAVLNYSIQLFVNFFWSIIFFRWQFYDAAFFWCILLFVFVCITKMSFDRIDRTASKLLIPYLVWVAFATYLTRGFSN